MVAESNLILQKSFIVVNVGKESCKDPFDRDLTVFSELTPLSLNSARDQATNRRN